MARRGRVGIADVAARAGVSVTTVSHVLSSRRPVAEATRAKVLEVIAELDYRPNEMARGMRSQRTSAIALLVPDLSHPFHTSAARGLQDAVRPKGYHCIVSATDGDGDVERDLIRQLMTRVDGMVIAGAEPGIVAVQPLIDAEVPLVLLGADIPGPGFDVVTNADYDAGAMAAHHLVDQGRRRIGFITGSQDFGGPARRVEGYRSAVERADPALVIRSDGSLEGGARCMARLLDAAEPPDAVICISDVVAIGALYAARDRSVAVPEDLAVIGFDDIEAAALVTPPLTTMATSSREHGAAAGELLLRRIDSAEQVEPRRVVFPATLVRRQSA
ncbi:MAG TPA: LacI family DNA-binding transcriptional regulator [Stackebrandtia sp.]|uniref:LacI family DNA-binding transcriptional regulator n=1 Tax=Stackebrandtia sp. TaxID=2023065 RepID=UPI002D4E9421|nr:LacI family DNA-binding transcriptional regulator [Stackebrandtia sp.]HZE37416.1 LacI family DNA-binding transcriptional regulator [Stackebrandtia sp.]